jgi:enoyl-CoA hydratase/carnithine racemase
MTWRREQHGAVAVLRFERPPENLMTYLLLDELDEALQRVAEDRAVTVVVLTGAIDGYFVGHADLADVEQLVTGRPGAGDPDAWGRALDRISAIPQPVVAAVNGQAWGGGCELALACLLRVAGTGAHFRFVEVAAGAIPGAGGTQRLPRLIGASRAAHMILTGRLVLAQEALTLGLVDAVLPDAAFLEHVLAWVAPIADQPRHTVLAAKRAMVDGLNLPLPEGLANEQRLFRAVLSSPESQRLFSMSPDAIHPRAMSPGAIHPDAIHPVALSPVATPAVPEQHEWSLR